MFDSSLLGLIVILYMCPYGESFFLTLGVGAVFQRCRLKAVLA